MQKNNNFIMTDRDIALYNIRENHSDSPKMGIKWLQRGF